MQGDDFLRVEDLVQEISEGNEGDKIKVHLNDPKYQALNAKRSLAPSQLEKLERQTNFEIVNTQVGKWVPVIQTNRRKAHYDFTLPQVQDAVSILEKAQENNEKNMSLLEKNVNSTLKSRNLDKESKIKEREDKLIESLDPQEAAKRIAEIRRQRSLMFYAELKHKRQAKIKSKMYHKIQKKRRMEEEQKKKEALAAVDPSYKLQMLEEEERARIKERISLRHHNQSKSMKSLKRFGDKESFQLSINDQNKLRRDIRNAHTKEVIKDLEDAEDIIENDNENEQDKLGSDSDEDSILKKMKEKSNEKESQKLLAESVLEEQEEFSGRKKFEAKKSQKSTLLQDQIKKKVKIQDQIREEIEEVDTNGDLAQTLKANQKVASLLDGFDLAKMQKKKNHNSKAALTEEEFKIFDDEQEQTFNQKIVFDNKIDNEFIEEKNETIGNDLPKDAPNMRGWGSWAGTGVRQPKVDEHKKKLETLQMIENLKKRRQDGAQDNLIFDESLESKSRKYRVQKLPHPYQNADQFDYMMSTPLGPEWATLAKHKRANQPQIKTKAGQVIAPIQMKIKEAKKKKSKEAGKQL